METLKNHFINLVTFISESWKVGGEEVGHDEDGVKGSLLVIVLKYILRGPIQKYDKGIRTHGVSEKNILCDVT